MCIPFPAVGAQPGALTPGGKWASRVLRSWSGRFTPRVLSNPVANFGSSDSWVSPHHHTLWCCLLHFLPHVSITQVLMAVSFPDPPCLWDWEVTVTWLLCNWYPWVQSGCLVAQLILGTAWGKMTLLLLPPPLPFPQNQVSLLLFPF